MFRFKLNIFITVMILLMLLSNVGVSQEYSAEMVSQCHQLTQDIDTSDWLIDEDLPVLDDSKLDRLDDGWNKKIKMANDHMLEVCKADKDSNACYLAKGTIHKIKKERYSCYYALLMKSI